MSEKQSEKASEEGSGRGPEHLRANNGRANAIHAVTHSWHARPHAKDRRSSANWGPLRRKGLELSNGDEDGDEYFVGQPCSPRIGD
eukprot:5253671-Alexandrium_andersonii.AAC.1